MQQDFTDKPRPQALKLGLLSVVPDSALMEQEKAESAKRANQLQTRPEVRGLAAHVHACWQAAKQAKQPIERRMLMCQRMRKGEYEPDHLLDIKQKGGSEVFMMLPDEKCSAAASWLRDILLQSGEEPWGIEPTPIPDLPQEIVQEVGQQVQLEVMQSLEADVSAFQQTAGIEATHQDVEERLRDIQPEVMKRFKTLYDERLQAEIKEAKLRANRAETKIKDIVIESSFEDALDEAIEDIVTFPCGFVQGPLVVRRKSLAWEQDETGQSHPKVVNKLVFSFKRISPHDVYPSPSSTDIDDGDLNIKHHMTRKDLDSLIGVPHFSAPAIRKCLQHYSSGMTNWLALDNQMTRERLEDRGQVISDPSGKIDVLQFYGSVQGRMLIMNGVPAERIPDPLAEYDAEVWLCGPYVLKATLNGDMLGRKPVYKASFRKVAGSFWGRAIPELIKDCTTTANAAARNLIDNMGLASGPQVGVDTGSMPPGESIESMYPWKIWQFDMKDATANKNPIWFFQPNSMTAELMKVYEFFSAEADNKTGIPKYSYGTGKTQGAAGTSSGLAMLMNSAARGIKGVIRNIDRGITCKSLTVLYDWVMLFMPDPALQGDCKIVARGSSALIAKEQQAVRRNEAMQIILSSPAVLGMIGPEGLAEFLRKYFQGLDVGADDIVPRKEEIAAQNNKDVIIQQLSEQVQQLQQLIGQNPQMIPQGQQALPIGREVDGAGSVQGGMEANFFPRG